MTDFKPAVRLPAVTDAEPVYCPACEQWFAPNPDWRCDCGLRAIYAVQPGTCPTCLQPALMLRSGCQIATLCRCAQSGEERLALEARWRELDQEDADEAAGIVRRPGRKAEPGLPDDAPLRDWWPPLLELLPGHIDRGPILDAVEVHREDFPLATVVGSLRRVLERVQRNQTTVGSPRYITGALARELGARSA